MPVASALPQSPTPRGGWIIFQQCMCDRSDAMDRRGHARQLMTRDRRAQSNGWLVTARLVMKVVRDSFRETSRCRVGGHCSKVKYARRAHTMARCCWPGRGIRGRGWPSMSPPRQSPSAVSCQCIYMLPPPISPTPAPPPRPLPPWLLNPLVAPPDQPPRTEPRDDGDADAEPEAEGNE